MVEDEQVVYTDPDGKVWHPHRGYWCWKVSSELAQSKERIKELEAQLAEAKAVLEKIAGSHLERIGYCQTDIDDVPDLTAEEAMLTARRILPALEATPPATKVMDEMVERAFRDGVRYGTICEVTDIDDAWRTSSVRAALTAEQESGQ